MQCASFPCVRKVHRHAAWSDRNTRVTMESTRNKMPAIEGCSLDPNAAAQGHEG